MVQIIQRAPSTADRFSQAFGGLGASLAKDIPEELFSRKEAKAFKERFGKDISGFRDPKMRQDILKSELETEAAKAKREQQQAVLEKFLGSEETQGFSDWEKQLITGEALGLIPSGTGKVLADMRRQREGRDFISQLFGEDSGETGMQPSMPDMGMEDSSALSQETLTGKIPSEPSSQKGAIPQSKLQKIPDAKLMQMIGMGGDTAKVAQAEIDRRNKEKEFELKKEKFKYEKEKDIKTQVEASHKAQEPFINDVTNAYKSFETEFKPRLMQMQSMDPEKLINPTAAVFLDTLGIPLGALEDPTSELYNKVSQDLLKGLPDTYGSRILKVEVDNFLKTIPTLMNSAEGRRMIASNMLKLGEMKEVYYNAMRRMQIDAIDNNKSLPKDFQQRVFDQVKPQIDRINQEFVKLSQVTSVPKGHTPYFSPSGNIEFVPNNLREWADKNGGRRIW